jgi:hypothetical protein
MIVFTFTGFVQRLLRLVVSTICLIVGMMVFLWYTGTKFAPRREWIHFPASLFLGIASSALLAVLYCKLNPMVSKFPLITYLLSLTGMTVIDHILLPIPSHHIDWNMHHPVNATASSSTTPSLSFQPVRSKVSGLVTVLHFHAGSPAWLHAGPQQVKVWRLLLY